MKKLQNKDSKKQYQNVKGITLIALVVTIVVLLILAGVTIVTLFGENGIISKAQKAKQETQEGVKNELDNLDKLGDIDKYINGNKNEGKWQEVKNEKGQVTAVEKGNQKIEIGDYINYDCTKNASGQAITESYTSYAYGKENNDHNGRTSGYNQDQTFKAKDYTGKWRVLGAEDGELLIMAATNVPLTAEDSTSTAKDFNLGTGNGYKYAEQGKAAFQYGVEELDNISAIYGKGNGATGARSIKPEDVNKITGYVPKAPAGKEENRYGKGELCEYGNDVTFTWGTYGLSGYGPEYTSTNGTNGKLEIEFASDFYYWDINEKKWEKDQYKSADSTNPITTLKNTGYHYYPETFREGQVWEGYDEIGLSTDCKAYKMLFDYDDSEAYWLASKSVQVVNTGVSFGLYNVYNGYLGCNDLFYSDNLGANTAYGIRPVVSLKSDIKLEKGSTDSDGTTTWNIK